MNPNQARSIAASIGGPSLQDVLSTSNISGNSIDTILKQMHTHPLGSSEVIFDASVRVSKVANGYVLEVSPTRGQAADAFIASTIDEVRALIVSQMIAARLEK